MLVVDWNDGCPTVHPCALDTISALQRPNLIKAFDTCQDTLNVLLAVVNRNGVDVVAHGKDGSD